LPQLDYPRFNHILTVQSSVILGILAQVPKFKSTLDLLGEVNAQLGFQFV
jgi:hypothetical protein